SGYTVAETRQNHFPCVGSVLSRLEGPTDPAVPPFVGLAPKMDFMGWADPGGPGFLGRAHAPLQPEGPVMGDMVLSGITLERLRDRRRLLESVDRTIRTAERSGALAELDGINQQAFDVLTSRKVVEALDVEREDPEVRDLYGRGSSKNVDDGGPC